MYTCESYKTEVFPRIHKSLVSHDEWHRIQSAVIHGDSVEVSLLDKLSPCSHFCIRYFNVDNEVDMFIHATKECEIEYELHEDCPVFTCGALVSKIRAIETLEAGFSIFIISQNNLSLDVLGLCTIVCPISDNS